MKTNNKTAAPATESSLDELIFENRNHAYGAYELRKKYDKRLFIGFLFAFILFTSAIGVQVIETYLSKTEFIIVPPISTKVEFANIEDLPIPPPPPPAPEPPVEIRRQAIFIPNIVEAVTEDDLLPVTTEEFLELTENDMPPVLAVVTKDNKHAEEIDVDPNKGLWSVEESATFNGGNINTFREWVVKNLTYPQEAMNSDISGRVNIIFGVNAKGEVCNVTVRRGVHPSLDDAVVRTILNSPAWQPAKQNGNPVKQMFSLIVFFRKS